MSCLLDVYAEGVNINSFQRSLSDVAVDEITSNSTNDMIGSTYAKVETAVIVTTIIEVFMFANNDMRIALLRSFCA